MIYLEREDKHIFVMDTGSFNWKYTKSALSEFEELLTCSICKSMLVDACSIQNCEHVFCSAIVFSLNRKCITAAIDDTAKCPDCGTFTWLKDIKANHELVDIIETCKKLKELLNTNADPNNGSKESRKLQTLEPNTTTEHTFEFSEMIDDTENQERHEKEVINVDSPIGWSQLGTRKGQQKPTKTYSKKDLKDKSSKRPSPCTLKEEKKKKTPESKDCKKRRTEETPTSIVTTPRAATVSTPQNKPSPRFAKINAKSVKKKNAKGETLLHAAAIKGDLDACREILANGADPNASDNARWTPLHEACNHGHLEIAKELLENGAHIGIQGFDNDTPLHDAVANNRLEVAKFLMEHYAPLTATNVNGHRPIDVASTAQMKELFANAENYQSELMEDRPTVLSNPGKQYVLLTTGLNPSEKKLVNQCADTLKATVQDHFSDEVTHIISGVNSLNCCPRTLKYLKAVLTGKWIISFNWIENCIKENAWVLEDKYVVDGTKDYIGIPWKARENFTKQNPPLLAGCSFYLHGEFKQPSPCKEDLQSLIRLGGGTILHTQPNREGHPLITGSSPRLVSTRTRPQQQQTDSPLPVAHHADDTNSLCTQFTLFDAQSTLPPAHVLTPLMATVNTTWFMNCITQFKILPTENYNSK